jgi:hypothetical protein
MTCDDLVCFSVLWFAGFNGSVFSCSRSGGMDIRVVILGVAIESERSSISAYRNDHQ